jgi:hypothetical protein
MLISTATAGAVQDGEIRDALGAALRGFDAKLEARLRKAIEAGDLPADADPAQLARVIAGVQQSMAVRARAGDSRDELEATGVAAIRLICGPEAN